MLPFRSNMGGNLVLQCFPSQKFPPSQSGHVFPRLFVHSLYISVIEKDVFCLVGERNFDLNCFESKSEVSPAGDMLSVWNKKNESENTNKSSCCKLLSQLKTGIDSSVKHTLSVLDKMHGLVCVIVLKRKRKKSNSRLEALVKRSLHGTVTVCQNRENSLTRIDLHSPRGFIRVFLTWTNET